MPYQNTRCSYYYYDYYLERLFFFSLLSSDSRWSLFLSYFFHSETKWWLVGSLFCSFSVYRIIYRSMRRQWPFMALHSACKQWEFWCRLWYWKYVAHKFRISPTPFICLRCKLISTTFGIMCFFSSFTLYMCRSHLLLLLLLLAPIKSIRFFQIAMIRRLSLDVLCTLTFRI